ncbi:MAG: Hsp20/alpha crystallin family protein [Bacilli bacterium]|nr:Hsp20/alpha crystallin family protein [Bacilli bacterium]
MLMPKIFDDDFFRDDFFDRKDRMNFNLMKTDIREDDKSYLLEIDLPGYSKDDIKIDITDGYLTINAKVEKENNDDSKNYVRRERFTGEVSRSFYVGEDIKEDEVKASFKNGILTLEVPKLSLEDKKKDKKYIEISE